MTSVVYGKRLVLARCKKCGRVYWYFSDIDTWNNFIDRLKRHLWWHVERGTMTPEEVKEGIDKWFEFKWYRVYNPAKINTTPENFERLHREFIPEPKYETFKELAMVLPTAFIEIARNAFEAHKLAEKLRE